MERLVFASTGDPRDFASSFREIDEDMTVEEAEQLVRAAGDFGVTDEPAGFELFLMSGGVL